MPGIVRSVARLTAWTAGLLAAGRVLYGAGSESLRIPLTSLTDFGTWLADTPPPMMAMAVIRLAALAAVGYLLMATVLAVAAGMIRARPLQAAAGRLTPALVRRMATGGSGVGLALGAALGTVSVPDLAPHPIVATGAAGANGSADGDSAPGTHNMATMLRVDDHVATMTRTSDPPPPGLSPAPTAGVTGPVGHGDRPGPEEPGFIPAPRTPSSGPTNPTNPANATEASPPATGNGDGPTGLTASSGPTDPADATPPATGDGGSRAGPTATPGPTGPAGGAAPAAGDDASPAGPAGLPPLTATMVRTDGSPAPPLGSLVSALAQAVDTWVVAPGDSFWSIAEDVLDARGGVPPGERDVGRYWRRLIDANRSGLLDPGNPDLLVPGQELLVPPP